MYPLQKNKTVTIIAFISIVAGVLLFAGEGFHIRAFQTVIPHDIKFNTAWACVVFGCVLLLTQLQIKKYNESALNEPEGQTDEDIIKKPVKVALLSEQLKRCEGNYHALIEQVSDAVYVLDFSGAFIEVNTSMCKMTGYSRDELLKLNIADLADPEQLKTGPVINVRRKPDETVKREIRLVRKTGQVFDVETTAKMFEEDRIMVTAIDISRQKEMETELRDAELKFQTLAEKSVTGVYIIQKEKLIYINSRFAEVFGYKKDELLNTPNFIELIIAEDYQAIVRRNIWARHRGEITYANYEVTGKKKDGTVIHIEFSGSRAIINNEPTIIGTMIDITDRWKTEELLKQSEANLQTILDTTDTAYALFDKQLVLTAFNKTAVKFANSQYNHIPSTGDQLVDYFPPERLPEFLKLANYVLKGNNTSYEINYPQADGSVLWYYVRLFPIANEKKEILGLMLALSDITERRNSEGSLQDAYKKIHDHLNSIRDMAWKQSHLIRSPLANLKGLVAMLQDNPADKEVLGYIQVELERLDKVIIEMAEDASNHD